MIEEFRRAGAGIRSARRWALAVVTCLALACTVPGSVAAPVSLHIEGLEPGAPFAAVLEDEAAKAYERAAAWFRDSIDRTITVVWVTGSAPPPEYHVGTSQRVAGLAIPSRTTILIFAPAISSRADRLRPVLLHEMCHLLLDEHTRSADLAPPKWLDEGLAMAISGTWDLGLDWRADNSSLLVDAAAAGSLLPLRELEDSFPAGPLFHLGYAESHSAVSSLLDRPGGEESMRRLLRRLASDEEFPEAFRRVYDVSFEDWEASWRSRIEPTGILGRLPSAGTLTVLGSVLASLLLLIRFIQVRRKLAQPEVLEVDPQESQPSPPSANPAQGIRIFLRSTEDGGTRDPGNPDFPSSAETRPGPRQE